MLALWRDTPITSPTSIRRRSLPPGHRPSAACRFLDGTDPLLRVQPGQLWRSRRRPPRAARSDRRRGGAARRRLLTLECTPRSALVRMELTVSRLGDKVGLTADTVRYYENATRPDDAVSSGRAQRLSRRRSRDRSPSGRYLTRDSCGRLAMSTGLCRDSLTAGRGLTAKAPDTRPRGECS
jgi:hypothetical protein